MKSSSKLYFRSSTLGRKLSNRKQTVTNQNTLELNILRRTFRNI